MSMDPSGPAGKIIIKIGREIGIPMDEPKKMKDGGLMQAIKKVDAEKGMKDGGMVGNTISNFKGTF